MVFTLNLLALLAHLALMGLVVQQLWHPYRSPRWARAWWLLLLALTGLAGRRIYDLGAPVDVWETVFVLGATGAFAASIALLAQIFAHELTPPPTLPLGHLTLDRSSVIRAWDQRAHEILGYTAEEVVGQSLYDTLIPAHSHAIYRAEVERYLAGYLAGTMTTRWHPFVVRHKNGQLCTVEILLMPALLPEGQAIFYGLLRQVMVW